MDATSLVYGDVVELREGDVVGADLRLIEISEECQLDQSSLVGEVGTTDEMEDLEAAATGGSLWLKKASVECTDQEDPVKSKNIALMGSKVQSGSAVGIVIATGDNTVWGQLLSVHQWPPNQKRDKRVEEVSLVGGRS
jgi:Mg2+-importing ATPase